MKTPFPLVGVQEVLRTALGGNALVAALEMLVLFPIAEGHDELEAFIQKQMKQFPVIGSRTRTKYLDYIRSEKARVQAEKSGLSATEVSRPEGALQTAKIICSDTRPGDLETETIHHLSSVLGIDAQEEVSGKGCNQAKELTVTQKSEFEERYLGDA